MVEFQGSVSLLVALLSIMLLKRFVGCIYRSLMELCTTPQFAVLLVSRWTRNTPTFAVCRNVRKLEHFTQPIKYSQKNCRNVRKLEHFTQPIKYSQKNCNSSRCAALRPKLTVACGQIANFLSCIAQRPLCHLIMACDQIRNFPSYVARRLLSHLIITYDQNTALSSDEARICVKHLHGVDEIRADEAIEYNRTTVQSDEAIEYNRTIVQSSKCGTGSILLNNVTKSRRAQSSVQTSINDTHNNYDSKLIKRYERDVRADNKINNNIIIRN